jgi:hypothetical protein
MKNLVRRIIYVIIFGILKKLPPPYIYNYLSPTNTIQVLVVVQPIGTDIGGQIIREKT